MVRHIKVKIYDNKNPVVSLKRETEKKVREGERKKEIYGEVCILIWREKSEAKKVRLVSFLIGREKRKKWRQT